MIRHSHAVSILVRSGLLHGLVSAVVWGTGTGLSAQESATKYAAQTGTFVLKIVGPDNEPIPGARVSLRSGTKPNWKVIQGTFDRNHLYGAFLETNSEGILEVEIPKTKLSRLAASIQAKGYRLFWASWDLGNKSERLPAKYTAHLDKGISYGGVVVDEEGKPVAGARVRPSLEYKKREGDLSQLGSGMSVTTDGAGRWEIHVVPAIANYLSISVSHADFMASNHRLSKSQFSFSGDVVPKSTITLKKGISLTGTVRDTKGKPIQGAILRVRARNRNLEALTKADGTYKLQNLEAGAMNLVATSATHAPGLQTVSVTEDSEPVDFVLEPPNTIRVTVRDAEGNPVPKTRVFFQDWRGDSHDDELDKVHSYTDANGEWVWDNAPPDSVTVDICPPGSMQIVDQVLQAGKKNEFISVPLLTIRGIVVDAESSKKVDSFRVVPGMIWPNRTEPYWINRDSFDGGEGIFTFKESRVDGQLLLRIEADGYAPQQTRKFKWDEGRVGAVLKLKPAAPTTLDVLAPDGKPASGASIVLGVKGTNVSMKSGEFSSTSANRLSTDENGQASMQPQSEPLVLYVTHETGYAEQLFDPEKPNAKIILNAWVTVEGVLKNGPNPAANTTISLEAERSFFGSGLPAVWHEYKVITDDEGQFRIERIRPGKFWVGHEVVAFRSSSSQSNGRSKQQEFMAKPGEHIDVKLGGNGHRVFGTLAMPADFPDRYDWEFSMPEITRMAARPAAIPVPKDLDKEEKNKWYEKWFASEEGKAWRATQDAYLKARSFRFLTNVDAEGRFEVFDLPSGKYQFSVQLAKPGKYAHGNDVLAKLDFEFEVPEFDKPFQSVDLETHELEPIAN